MSDEHPTNEFPAYGAPKPSPAAPDGPGAQPPAAVPQPPPFGSGPQQQQPEYGAAGPGGPGRSRRLTLILAAAIVVVLGAGIGVAVAVGTDDGGTPKVSPSATAAGSPDAGKQGKNGNKQGKRNVVRGTITAQSGSTWTLKTLEGKTVKVTIGSDTKFGTAKEAAKQADFIVGTKVVVAGKPGEGSDEAVTARRVRALPANAGRQNGKKAGSTPAPSSSPS